MSKELEAFDRVWEDCSKLDLDYVSKHNLMDDLREIKKALTPPTADEVCEALSEYLKEPIKYVRTSFVNERETAEVCGLFGLDNYDLVDFNTPLPPRLITLIGRFYEGLEELK